MIFEEHGPTYDGDQLMEGLRAPADLARRFGLDAPPPIIGMPHHDDHAYFSHAVSPFARDRSPVMVVVVDGSGDVGSVSLYLAENGRLRQLRCNDSLFDSLGMFYAVLSATQGGWTALSSEGRYMGASAYGDTNRATNSHLFATARHFRAPRRGRGAPQPLAGELAPQHDAQALHAGAGRHHRAARFRRKTCGIRTPCCGSRTYSTTPIRRTGWTRRRPSRWCSRTR